MVDRLQGKVAIITGAGSIGPGWGNGRSMAVLFAEEGARIFAVDNDRSHMTETLERLGSLGAEVDTFEADVTDPSSIAQMVQTCRTRFGSIDVLVNNVGGPDPGGVVELDNQDWEAQLRWNLTSTYLACKETIPVMIDQGGGSIVNIASISGIRYSGAPAVGYAAAKAGIIQLSRVTAVQYAKFGVRVNSVLPGQLHTPMVEARLADQQTGGDAGELLRRRVARIPLGFAGDGRDTAFAALYLASEEARFVTGTEIVVDGGMTARCD